MTDAIMVVSLVVMLAWIVWLSVNKWQHRERIDPWVDLFDERDRDCIG